MSRGKRKRRNDDIKEELIAFRVSKEDRIVLESIAAKEDRSLSAIVRRVMHDYVNRVVTK